MVLEVQVTMVCSVNKANGAPTSTGTSWRHASPEFDGLSDAASLTSTETSLATNAPLEETTGSADDIVKVRGVGGAAICA